MISSSSAVVVVDMRALAGNFNSEYIDIIDSHNIDEDFFIEDLSEFSNEEIAAPIHKNLMDHYPPSTFHHLQQHSDDHSASDHSKEYPPSTIKSDCTTTAHTSPSPSVLLQHTNAASEYSSSLHIDMKGSPLSLPCQDETGFDWLTAFGEDNLIYGASNLGMVDDSSFLLSSVEPFGNYDQGLIMKHSAYEDAIKVKDMQVGHNISGASTDDERGGEDNDLRWSNEDVIKGYNVMTFTPHATGSRSARSKRARSAGWSSSNILCNNWENNSPTNSLSSTSQIMIPQYSTSPTFNIACKEEEKKEQNDYSTTTNHMELISASFDNAPKTDKPLTKFCSNDQALRGSWAKEEDNTREESVSNYGAGGLQPRRCTHCFSQKTPQWRAGPEGPKTLCNACGVRFKSGRLFDEYRPAKSPTFLSYKHSNSHKKVMEMRRRKAFHYNYHHHQHQQQHAAAQDVRALALPPLKHGDVDSHLVCNKLKIKLNPATLDPHKHFSDVTLISTRNAVESPSSFLY